MIVSALLEAPSAIKGQIGCKFEGWKYGVACASSELYIDSNYFIGSAILMFRSCFAPHHSL